MVNGDWQGIILSDLTSELWGNGHQHSIFFFFQFESNRCLLTDQIAKIIMVDTLVHPSNKPVDLVFPVASISTFYKMGGLFLHSSSWRRQFKGSQEAACFFETFSNIDVMNHILHTDDAIFPKRLCNQCVIHQGNSLLVDFAITMLQINSFTDFGFGFP